MTPWIWRAVDQTGLVLHALVEGQRDRRAAERLLCKLLKRGGWAHRVMITDKPTSYGAVEKDEARRQHRRHRG